MESLILVAVLILLILLGAPIALAMLLLPTGYILLTDAAPLLTIPHQMYEAIAKVPLIAIPFFMLTGELMNSSTITERILELSKRIVGRLRGGLAQVNIVASMFFAGMNGSAVADTATVGTILIPAMKRAGYSAAFSAGITAVSSTIGGIIPPSIAMIILASGASLSVGALFAGGILPGILIGLAMMVITYVIAVRRNYERSDEPFSLPALIGAFWHAAFALIIPLVLVGGIVGGVFSSVEAGAVTALVAFALGTLVYRSLDFAAVHGAFVRSMKLSASVFIIIAAAGPLSWVMTKIGTLTALEQWLGGYADTPVLFVLLLIGFIILAGMFMDATANIIVLGPMLVSVCGEAGFPPIQAALVIVVGFLMGTVTPPVGVCYFTANYIAKARLERTAVEMLPFILVEIVVLVLMFAVPPLTMALPRAFGFL